MIIEFLLEETLLKKGFFQAIFPKLLKVLGKGFKGKTLSQKDFPLKLMTLPLVRGDSCCSRPYWAEQAQGLPFTVWPVAALQSRRRPEGR